MCGSSIRLIIIPLETLICRHQKKYEKATGERPRGKRYVEDMGRSVEQLTWVHHL